MTTAALIAAGFVGRFRSRVMAPVLVALVWPAVGASAAIGFVLGRVVRTRAAARHRRAAAEGAVGDLAELVALGLAAGHNVHGALSAATRHVPEPLQREVAAVLRLARRRGLPGALASTAGVADDLFAVIGRALERGAPLVDVATAWAEERRLAAQAEATVRVERLPVLLLFPLALLVLPGFMLLILTPAVVTAVQRLSG